MKFGEFKELGFPTSMEMEDALAHALFAKQTLLHPDDEVFWEQRNTYKQMKDKLNSLCAALKTR